MNQGMGEIPRPGTMLAKADLPRLVAEHADFIWRTVRRLGVPESMADDATQQVCFALMSRIETVVVGRERAFLFSVAMNVAAHVRRTLARRREVGRETLDIQDLAPLPDDALDQRRARALLDEVLDGMEIDLRTVFVMVELEEMTMADVASVLEVPSGTVASRLRRARDEFQRNAQRVRARLERVTTQSSSFVPAPSSSDLAVAGGGITR
jgi:RNA polymerase sigma-70 factor (ECF subfamily)